MTQIKFTVLYDTYCGWCYGAARVLEALASSDAEVEVLHRQLFVGANAYRMADGFGAQAIRIDAQIGRLTGQEFSNAYMDNILRAKDEVLNSELTAQAAALVHDKGARAELALAARLQKCRFVDGISACDRAAVVDQLVAEGVPAQTAEQLGTAPLREKAAQTAQKAAQLMMQFGVGGVPAVVRTGPSGGEIIDVSRYYARPNDILSLTS